MCGDGERRLTAAAGYKHYNGHGEIFYAATGYLHYNDVMVDVLWPLQDTNIIMCMGRRFTAATNIITDYWKAVYGRHRVL